jgi:hypothetical protein
MLAAALAVAGCGGDDEPAETTAGTTADEAPTTMGETTAETTDTTETEEAETETDDETTSPEEQEGGAGDEEPIRSEAVITGGGGELSPRRIQVPAFIAVGVILRSGDGRAYTLRIGGETLRVNGSRRRDEATLEGLRPGEEYRGGGVRIEATAEPGP